MGDVPASREVDDEAGDGRSMVTGRVSSEYDPAAVWTEHC